MRRRKQLAMRRHKKFWKGSNRVFIRWTKMFAAVYGVPYGRLMSPPDLPVKSSAEIIKDIEEMDRQLLWLLEENYGCHDKRCRNYRGVLDYAPTFQFICADCKEKVK